MVTSEIEKILLASWLLGENTDHMKYFQPMDFPENPMVFDLLSKGEKDSVTIAQKAGVKMVDMAEIIQHYAPALYESAMMQLAKDISHRWISNHLDASPLEIAEGMKQFVFSAEDLPKPGTSVDDFIKELEDRNNRPIVNTGIRDLDRMLCGIRKKELTAIGARPSVGKSAFVQQVAIQVARSGHKVLFFPLEMSQTALMERILLRYVDIPQYEMKTGFKPETWKRADVSEAFDKLDAMMSSGNMMVFEGVTDIQMIKRLIEYHKPYMIVIDQLEQLSDGKQKWSDKRQRFSHMTHELQRVAMDMDVAVWLACQVNRSADNSEPTLANLKESGTIEEDSDNVILLHRIGEKTANQKIKLELAKQRNGECGSVGLVFMASKYTFYGEER